MTFIVAEIGVNWDGNFELAKNMMSNAKISGCDAVKFQAFDETMIKNHPASTRLIKTAISKTNIETIDELSKSVGIEWFCTPMYPDAVDMLEPYVKRFKVREIDGRPLLKNEITPLLERVLKSNKEIIISSQRSPKESKYFRNSQIKWLYCVPNYPCDVQDIDFSNLRDFHGFSNHSNEIIVPVEASILGAKIIEMHITSDKSKDYFDNNVSFDYSELKEIVRLIRTSEKIKK